MIDISSACPALLVAVRDALHHELCRRKFSCSLKEKSPNENLRQFIRRCWQIVPESVRESTFQRLQLCRFACTFGYAQSMSWSRFLEYFDESPMMGEAIRDHYDAWQERHKRPRPAKALYRILLNKARLPLEAAAYILEPLQSPVRHEIAGMLLTELCRVCWRVTFVAPDPSRSQQLEIQFARGDLPERRSLEPNLAL